LAEIQQTSDITYRIYDFERIDLNGNKRELHTAEAVDAIDYTYLSEYKTPYTSPHNSVEQIIQGPYFETSIQQTSGSADINLNKNSFTILLAVEGSGHISFEDITITFFNGRINFNSCVYSKD